MRWVFFSVVTILLGLCALAVHAGIFSYFVSDVISTSAPSADATHTIHLTLKSDIPPSGHFKLTLDPGNFDIPASFDYTDMDFAYSTTSGATFTERRLAATPDAINDGVAVTAGTSSTIDITLNSTEGISAGDVVQLKLGTNATYGDTGTVDIPNPATPASYHVYFETRDALNVLQDKGDTIIVVIQPVSLTGKVIALAPVRSNGLPSGLIAANNTQIELSLNTDILAHCRYATTTGVLYDDMINDFNPDSGTTHWVNTSGYQNNTTYTFYVRCISTVYFLANSDDYPITFTLKPTPISNTSATSTGDITNGPTGDLGPGGIGNYSNGSDKLYLSSVTLTGTTIPNSTVTALQDGVKVGSVSAKGDGTFTATIDQLERGAYGFELYAQDSTGLASSLYSTTLSVSQGTDNSVTNIVIPPTIQLSASTASPGDKIIVTGFAPPNSILQVTLAPQVASTTQKAIKSYTASSSTSGAWSIPIDTSALTKGVYGVQANAAISTTTKSALSKTATFSLGAASAGSCGSPDMNGDGKVNLVDFSIFLLSWGTDAPQADYNCDGAVNLADFSIMLFNWTG